MNDKVETGQPYPITLPELFEYLSSFTPATCDFCGSKSWTVMLNDLGQISVISGNESQVLLEKIDDSGKQEWRWRPILSNSEKVFQLRCKNCGQVKYFSYDEVLRKIDKMRQEKGNDKSR
ncbi:MAG TPA: hypothetical protein IAC89_01590 [Candidatus Aphodousia faecalis]|nr:hypothetical protein [Candidatus Aphodousia faecalis]